MSQENVEIMRRLHEAYPRADWESVAASFDPDVFVRTDPRWPEQFIFGRQAWVDNLRGMWESVGGDARIEGIVDLGDRVLVRFGFGMHGQQSGIEGEQSVSEIATVRGGRSIFVEYFLDHEQALKAVGLAE